VSSSRREPADLAALYARKASNDTTAAREFADNSEISDESSASMLSRLSRSG
jgi:hypothetical protein